MSTVQLSLSSQSALATHLPVGIQLHKPAPDGSQWPASMIGLQLQSPSTLQIVFWQLMSIEKLSMLGPEKLLPLGSPASNVKQTRPFLPANWSRWSSTLWHLPSVQPLILSLDQSGSAMLDTTELHSTEPVLGSTAPQYWPPVWNVTLSLSSGALSAHSPSTVLQVSPAMVQSLGSAHGICEPGGLLYVSWPHHSVIRLTLKLTTS